MVNTEIKSKKWQTKLPTTTARATPKEALTQMCLILVVHTAILITVVIFLCVIAIKLYHLIKR